MPTDPNQTPARQPVRVLLVEDLSEHQTLVELQVATFRQPTVLLAVASTVGRAVEILEERADEVDVIVTDLGLPDGQGVEVVETILAAAPGKPAVVLSSRVEQGVSSLEAGAQDYLVKGQTDAGALERAIRHAMTRQALANELLATTRDVEHLVYSVSHDLRGPLSVANGFVSLLEEATLPADAAALVAPIRRSLLRLDTITSDLIEYARSVHGALDLAVVDLALLATSVIHDQLVTDVVQVDQEMPMVHGDARLLRHVFENLIGNAVKYADPARTIEVSVSAFRHPAGWQVNVDDNGIGVPHAARTKVFDMFIRAADESIDGTGIGLAICRRAVERHNGRIWVEDNPTGVGTRMAFILPTVADDQLVPASETVPPG